MPWAPVLLNKYTKCLKLGKMSRNHKGKRKGTAYEIGRNQTSGISPKPSTKSISRRQQ